MNKFFAKLGMPSVLAVLFLLGGMLLGSDVQAQTIKQAAGPGIIKAGVSANFSWVTPNVAISRLNAEVAVMQAQIDAGNTSTVLQTKAKLYEAIVYSLEKGWDTGVSVNSNYGEAAQINDMGQKTLTPGVSNSDWASIYQGLVDLLKV